MSARYFSYRNGKMKLPVFFPDATRAVVRTLDFQDIYSTKTEGLLVNTLHLMVNPGEEVIKSFGGIAPFMGWSGALISDSGGFQVGSLIKKNPKLGRVVDSGAIFRLPGSGQVINLTPEESVRFQMNLGVDMVVVLDDFDAPDSSEDKLKKSVERTISWAMRSKKEFLKICKHRKLSESKRPYILGVIQGGRNKKLRQYCARELIKIGFDGLGYGGEEKIGGVKVNYNLAKFVASLVPKEYLLYALGVGKPEDIVALSKIGFDIFDCVLPTRDGRHRRLYVYRADSIDRIDLSRKDFYYYYVPDKIKYAKSKMSVSMACDCLLCKNYTRAYLHHITKINDTLSMRLGTMHNLRFYSLLIEKLRMRRPG